MLQAVPEGTAITRGQRRWRLRRETSFSCDKHNDCWDCQCITCFRAGLFFHGYVFPHYKYAFVDTELPLMNKTTGRHKEREVLTRRPFSGNQLKAIQSSACGIMLNSNPGWCPRFTVRAFPVHHMYIWQHKVRHLHPFSNTWVIQCAHAQTKE